MPTTSRNYASYWGYMTWPLLSQFSQASEGDGQIKKWSQQQYINPSELVLNSVWMNWDKLNSVCSWAWKDKDEFHIQAKDSMCLKVQIHETRSCVQGLKNSMNRIWEIRLELKLVILRWPTERLDLALCKQRSVIEELRKDDKYLRKFH